jgi:prepilin peptidase CpaA
MPHSIVSGKLQGRTMLELACLFAFPAAVAFAGAMDLFSMTIPNKISLVLIATFFAAAVMAGLSVEAIGMHVATGLGILAITVFMFFMGWIGGGDAKLTAAVALWIGFDLLATYLLWATLLGGALSVAILAFRKMPLSGLAGQQPWLVRLHAPRGGVPYGIALSIAAVLVYPDTAIYLALSLHA